jgi:glycerol-3-phosphate cytidylyltransferase-like family protein
MKSAYELAMERLQKAAPSHSLTDNQKKELADVESKYRAKIAEKELFLKELILKAQAQDKLEDVESLQKQLVSELRRLQDECEAKKEKLRASFEQNL